MSRAKMFPRLAALFLPLLFPGCGGSSSQFYRLSAEAPAHTRAARDLSLGVGPIALPSYIDRAELVFQSGPNEFQIPPNVSWAGSLRENITNVLARNLRQILGSGEVATFPFPTGRTPAYRVALDVRQFHGISGGNAILDATWRIQNRAGDLIVTHNAIFQQPISGDGYAAVVAAESRVLADCAAAIAKSLP